MAYVTQVDEASAPSDPPNIELEATNSVDMNRRDSVNSITGEVFKTSWDKK